jgi:hypothetical protein
MQIVYHLGPDSTWLEYHPVATTMRLNRITQQTKVWYNMAMGRRSQSDMAVLLLTTVYWDTQVEDQLYYMAPSSNPLPTISPQTASSTVWEIDPSLHILAETPEFYQWLVGPPAKSQ